MDDAARRNRGPAAVPADAKEFVDLATTGQLVVVNYHAFKAWQVEEAVTDVFSAVRPDGEPEPAPTPAAVPEAPTWQIAVPVAAETPAPEAPHTPPPASQAPPPAPQAPPTPSAAEERPFSAWDDRRGGNDEQPLSVTDDQRTAAGDQRLSTTDHQRIAPTAQPFSAWDDGRGEAAEQPFDDRRTLPSRQPFSAWDDGRGAGAQPFSAFEDQRTPTAEQPAATVDDGRGVDPARAFSAFSAFAEGRAAAREQRATQHGGTNGAAIHRSDVDPTGAAYAARPNDSATAPNSAVAPAAFADATPGADDPSEAVTAVLGTAPLVPGAERNDQDAPTEAVGSAAGEPTVARAATTADAATVDPGADDLGAGAPAVDAPAADAPTTVPAGAGAPPTSDADDTANRSDDGKRRGVLGRRVLLAAAIVLGLVGIAYVVDLAVSSGKVPRGVTVAGVDVGGQSRAQAQATLQRTLDARAAQPIAVRAGAVQEQLVPAASGITVDWPATMAGTGEQSRNPITRLTSLFTSRSVPVVSAVDDAALTAAVEKVRVQADRQPVDGGVVFNGVEPVAVRPVAGAQLDVPGAKQAIVDRWTAGAEIPLPVTETPVTVSDAVVQQTLSAAQQAIASDIEVTGHGKNATLSREQLGTVLRYGPDGKGGLVPIVDPDGTTKILGPQLASTEVKAKDASFALTGSTPTVVPSVVGDMVSWPKTLEQLPIALGQPGNRSIAAVYEQVQPKLSTADAKSLGIKQVIAEFSTGGFESASGVNIRRVAEVVDGAVVKPGDTFSLNKHTGTRGAAQGYVESTVINHGKPEKAVGGGISQFATTLYNAAYFAGLEDVEHTEHSYYISRYPEAREATVFDGAIDLQFRNNSQTGILIETAWSPSTVTVRIWGTKTVNVESVTGPRTAPTQPQKQFLPKGPDCIASKGGPGFTASNTRIVTDVNSGKEVSRQTRTVKYDPVPDITCGEPPSAESNAAPQPATSSAPRPADDPSTTSRPAPTTTPRAPVPTTPPARTTTPAPTTTPGADDDEGGN